MRIIAVMSPKGGIGKTTTSDSIAYMLGEEQGKRVLVLDGDPQGDTSDAYDYCICDCGRLLDMVVINILIATELIIAPVKVGGYEIEALQNLEEQIEDLRDINPDLRIKALMTMRQKNKTSLEVEEWLKAESGFDMFVTPVRRSIVAEKSTTAMIPLPKFSKCGIVSQDYRCVVHELLKEMEG